MACLRSLFFVENLSLITMLAMGKGYTISAIDRGLRILLLFFVLMAPSVGWGQVIEMARFQFQNTLNSSVNIGNPTLNPSGTWGYTTGGYSGRGYQCSSDGDSLDITISTVGYKNISVKWAARSRYASPYNNSFTMSTNNGSTWNTNAYTQVLTSSYNSLPRISLDNSYDNNPNVVIRILHVQNTSWSRLDDIIIEGEPKYCSAAATNTSYEYISKVQLGTISNTSGSSGYSDFTAQSTDVMLGSTNSLIVTNGNSDPSDYCGVWVDWNDDGDFDDADEVVGSSIRGTGPYAFNVNVPTGITAGKKRMRICISYNGIPYSCGNINYGEVEDYTVNVLPAVTYYSRGGDPTLLSSWSLNRTGAIASPPNFTNPNQVFVVQQNSTMTANSAWNISGANTKLQLEDGATLTANAAVTLSSNTTLQLDANSTYAHNNTGNAATTIFNAGTEVIDPTSTVTYGYAGAQNVAAATYGNLTIAGGGAKTLQGGAEVRGTLDLQQGALALGGNLLTLSGDVTRTGAASGTITGGATSNLTIGGSGSLGTLFFTAGTQTLNNLTLNRTTSGVATLGTPLTINGTLTLTSGKLQLGNNDLTIANPSTFAIAGAPFSANNMVETNGTGSLVKAGSAVNDFRITYPVGNGNVYSPMVLSTLTGTVAPGATLKVRSEAAAASDIPGDTPLNRNWVTASAGISGTVRAGVRFSYNASDVPAGVTAADYKFLYKPSAWGVPGGTVTNSGSELSASAATSLAAVWSASITPPEIFYSFQSGKWDDPDSWTYDPSGTVNPGAGVPGAGDVVHIIKGDVIVTEVNGIVVKELDIKDGAVDLKATSGHNFGTVYGTGILRLTSNTFPGGDFSQFDSATGGTTEFYGSAADFNFPKMTFNNLIVNLDNTTSKRIVAGTNNALFTINGSLTVKKGIFQIGTDGGTNTSAKVVVDVKKDITVESVGTIKVGTTKIHDGSVPGAGYAGGSLVPRYYDVYHKVYIGGNLYNKGGVVKFISDNITYPTYTWLAAEGAASVRFYGLSNALLQCDGQTDFYNLIMDKGSDQTYELNVSAKQYWHFRLFGCNAWGGFGAGANPEIRKALWIKNGTVRLTGSVTIPSLVEGRPNPSTPNSGDPNQDYFIPANGALVLDGSDVVVITTADDYREVNAAYNLSMPSNQCGIQYHGGDPTSFSIYGTMRVNDGYLSTRESGGLIFWPVVSGVMEINGGFVDAKQLRSADGNAGIASYIQTGGVFQLRGQYEISTAGINTGARNALKVANSFTGNTNQTGLQDTRGTFNIESANNVFTMTGGEIRLYKSIGDSDQGGVYDNMSTNYTVTGGTVRIISDNAERKRIGSYPPIYNLVISKSNSNVGYAEIDTRAGSLPLTVLNDLTIENNARLNNTNTSLSVGHDFTLGTGAIFDNRSAVLNFNGNGAQVFDIKGRFYNNGTSDQGVQDVSLSNKSNLTIQSNGLLVRNSLTISPECVLNDNGQTVTVRGNITNSGLHQSNGAGSITLDNNLAQQIGGDGDGVFGNLFINKSGGSVSLSSNASVNGDLRMATNSSSLNIGSYNLKLGNASNVYSAMVGTTQAFNASRMIVTGGLGSDGGVTRTWGATGAFLYPVGTTGKYRPATLTFNSAPTAWGDVTVRPVASRHKLLPGTNNALTYYWSVSSNGVAGLPSNAVSWKFDYSNGFVAADLGGGAEANYEARIYNPVTWEQKGVSTVNETNHYIELPGYSKVNGDFVACLSTLGNSVPAYYSNPTLLNGGVYRWEDKENWTTDEARTTPATSAPATGALVVIGGSSLNHTITATGNNKATGGLIIYKNSTLDIGTTTGHNFGDAEGESVGGQGTLRIASNYFPAGDFGAFLNTGGGIVEYYTKTVSLTLNAASVKYTYNRLVLNPTQAAHSITVTQSPLTTNENLETKGPGAALINVSSTVKGDLNVQEGRMSINAAVPISVHNDVNVSAGATFNVINGTTGTLTISGNLKNDGTFDMNGTGVRTPVYFKGTENKTISGGGVTTDFYTLTVDKGSDQTPILEVAGINISFANLAQALFINNGTFKVSSSQALSLTTTSDFVIPTSGCLTNNGATLTIGNTGANGLRLLGKFENLSGTTNIGKDIEYASAGLPEFSMAGGAVNVNGQVRRNTSNTVGSLKYTQSGGDLLVRGVGVTSSRGVFELLNNSIYNTSGGTITLQAAAGGAMGDVYINPASSTVTGGTWLLGNGATASNSNFMLYSSVPLWSLEVNDATRPKSVQLNSVPLDLKGDLVIDAGNTFRADDLDVTIGGSLINSNTNAAVGINQGGYQASTSATSVQNTTLKGGAGAITGVAGNLTNFANLIVEKTSLALNANTSIRVNGNFTHKSGTIQDGSNYIDIAGNIETAGVVQSASTSGGVRMVGAAVQSISDYDGKPGATFGNFTIDNSAGRVDLMDNLTISKKLSFVTGIFNIAGKELTLGAASTVEGASKTAYITTNGVNFDLGVVKNYAVGNNTFTYPIGVAGKYTPVTIGINELSKAGAVRIKPLNEKHPNLVGATDDQLSYYWKIDATGFQNYTANMLFNYLQTDVSGNETAYVGGRYYNGNWNPSLGIAGAVNAGANTITLSNQATVVGDFTAGESPNFDDQHVYYSRVVNGFWDDPNSWRLDSPSGPTATVAPNGNQVIIQNNHTITIRNNKEGATYSLEVQEGGTLDLGKTWGHNFRVLRGGGTVKVTASDDGQFKWVACDASEFVVNPTATFIFTGAGEFEDEYSTLPNVVLNGAGVKLHDRSPLIVRQNLTIDGGTLVKTYIAGQSSKNYYLHIYGDWINNVGLLGFDESKVCVVNFSGDKAQTLRSVADESFYTFQITKTGEKLTLDAKTIVVWNLLMYSGVIKSFPTKELFHYFTNPIAYSGGSVCYVDGPMQKRLLNGVTFEFPIGKDGRVGKTTVNAITQTTSPGIWEAEYYNASPSTNTPSLDPKSLQAPLETVSNDEYWRIKGPAGGQSNVKLRWDASSAVVPLGVTSRQKLRVAEWDGAKWVGVGNKVTEGAKTVETTTSRSLAGVSKYYTLSVESLPTATINDASSTKSGCLRETPTVVLDLTGNPNFTVGYKIDEGATQTVSGITGSPYSISKTGYQWGGIGDHILRVVSISDNAFTGIKDFVKTITITVKDTPDPTIDGKLTAAKGETVTYEVHDKKPSSTYLWTVTNGAIQGANTGNTITVKWNTTATSGTVYVKETNTTTTCFDDETINVALQASLSPAIVTANVDKLTNACANETVTYSTSYVAGHGYSWNVTGGTYVNAGAGNDASIKVTWGSSGVGSVSVTETASGFAPGTDTKNITIRSYPSSSPTLTDISVCNGSSGEIVIDNPEADIFYQLQLEPANSDVGSEINSAPYKFVVSPAATSTYHVRARSEYGCAVVLPDKATVTVNAKPTATLTLSDADGKICKDASITFTAPAGEANYEFFVGGVSKQSGASNIFTTNSLADGSKVKVSVTNAAGCVASSTESTITVMNPAGTPSDITGVTTVGTLPKSEVYTSGGLTAPNTYRWEVSPAGFGTVGANGGDSFSVNWTTSGNYLVKVFGTNEGCGDGGSKQLVVNVGLPAKPVTPTTTTNPICQGTASSTVSISAAPAGADANLYVWTLSPSTAGTITGTTASATIAWDAAFSGNATVTVTARNASGSGPVSDALTITIKPAPTVTWDAANVYKGCADGTTVLTLDNITTGLTYTWSVQDDVGVVSSNSYQPTITWLSNGAIFGAGVVQVSKNVTVVVTGGNGCAATLTKSVTVYRRPVTGPPYHIGNNIAK